MLRTATNARYCVQACPVKATPVVLNRSRPSRKVFGPVCFRENEKPVSKDVEQKVGQATSKVSSTVTGFLSQPSAQSTAYWALGHIAVASAVAALLFPAQFAGLMFGAPTDRVIDSIVRGAGATLITSATVKYTLKEAALRGQLYMDTFKRLNIGLMLQCATCLVVLAQGISLQNNLLAAFVGGVCGAGFLVASRVYALNKQGFPFPSPLKTMSGAISVLMPRNLTATCYSLLTLVFAGMAAMCLGSSPGKPLVIYEGLSGPMSVFMHRVTGAGMLLQTLVAYSLKDGADREKLGATTFRWLNLGLATSLLAMVAHMTIDWQSGLLLRSPKSIGMLATQMAAFAWTSYMYVAGESKAKPAPAAGTA